MSWRAIHRRVILSLLFVCAAGVGCRHGGRSTAPTQPFRDEVERDDGFQYYESAVPGGGEVSDKAASESASETTVEVEIDDSGEGSGGSAAAGDRADEDEAGDDGEGDDGDEGNGDEGDEGGEGAAATGARADPDRAP